MQEAKLRADCRAGGRKFTTEHISRNDLASLTPEATELSGIPHVMDLDGVEVEAILKSAH